MALFLAGNENANQEGGLICCMPSPQLPWAIPDLDAVALQNSIVCPSPSCQNPGQGTTKVLPLR